MKKYISWRRVSTFKQNRSGLGLEAQKEIIRYFIERDNGEWIADYEECYTGTELSGCTELKKAISHAKRIDAILIIAKTDRFRNTAEALKIYEEMGDGRIMFCDLPTSDKFSLTLFFALAEREALIVSIRTKQALAVKKAQGAKLGAASDKYRANRQTKTNEQIAAEGARKGRTKNKRFLDSRDTKTFLKILQRTFPSACKDINPCKWYWDLMRLTSTVRPKILTMMQDFKDMDADGTLFAKWNFASDKDSLRRKLDATMYTVKRSMRTRAQLSNK